VTATTVYAFQGTRARALGNGLSRAAINAAQYVTVSAQEPGDDTAHYAAMAQLSLH
jgi:hypothetical protein